MTDDAKEAASFSAFLFFILVLLVLIAQCTSSISNNSKLESLAPIQTADNWNDSLKGNLKVICIDGFEYYFSSVVGGGESSDRSRAVLAPKFDKETALPKRCGGEKEK